eukprot:Gb_04185 [translate_table: standard]
MVAGEFMENWIPSTELYNKRASHQSRKVDIRTSCENKDGQSRRNPSFSSALLEAISKSTENSTEELRICKGQKMQMKISRDSSIRRADKEEPRVAIMHNRSGEIDIFEAEKYFSYETERSTNPTDDEDQVMENSKHRDAALFSFQSDTCSDRSSVNNLYTPNWKFSSSEADQSQCRTTRRGSTKAADVAISKQYGSSACKWENSTNSHSLDHSEERSLHKSRERHGVSMKENLMTARHSKLSQEPTKKPKQPMSPGSKLASFLNSLFIPTSTKKKPKQNDQAIGDSGSACGGRPRRKERSAKADNGTNSSEKGSYSVYSRSSSADLGTHTPSSTRTNASTSSSVASLNISSSSQIKDLYKSIMQDKKKDDHVMKRYDSSLDACSYHHVKLKSSFSRSTKNDTGGVRRSVTFYPTSVILDENARPCGEKYLTRVENPKNYNLPLLSKTLRLKLLDQGRIPSEYLIHHPDGKYSSHKSKSSLALDVDDDDADSDSSSDLFELENFDAMDMSIYSRDLPVYGTTHMETNKAIANGSL